MISYKDAAKEAAAILTDSVSLILDRLDERIQDAIKNGYVDQIDVTPTLEGIDRLLLASVTEACAEYGWEITHYTGSQMDPCSIWYMKKK